MQPKIFMKKISKPVFISLIALLTLLAVGAAAFFLLFAPMEGHWYLKNSSSITADAVDREALSAFPRLKVLSALEADLTVAEAEAINAQYPAMDLIWSVPLSQGKVSSISDAVTLTAEEDIALLPFFSSLKEVRAEGAAVCPALLAAQEDMPHCAFIYEVTLGGTAFPMDTKVLTLTAMEELEDLKEAMPYFTALEKVDASALPLTMETARYLKDLGTVSLSTVLGDAQETETVTLPAEKEPDLEELCALYTLLPKLKTVDLTACAVSTDFVAKLEEACPHLQVLWTDAVFGPSDSAAPSLNFTQGTEEELQAYLACFPALKEADVSQLPLTNEALSALLGAFPETAFAYYVEMDGEKIAHDVTELNWDNRDIGDIDSLYTGLPLLKGLTKITLHYCSLSNEVLSDLREKNPQTKVVWTIQLTKKLAVPTDAVAFSTMAGGNNTKRLTSEKASVLRYCTDLIVLDLGHNDISDLSWLESLTNLQVLILADNEITDMTSIGKLTKLKYLELFMNKVSDISAVENLPELLDFNMCWTKVEDATPLLKCKKLERIWLASCFNLTEESKEALMAAFPNAAFDFESPSCTRKGWREHPRYEAFREMFETNVPVAPFLPE